MDHQTKLGVIRAYRKQYLKAAKSEKTQLLDRIVAVTGYDRKHLIRALSRPKQAPKRITRPRPSRYAPILEPLRFLWAAANFACGKRLHPFLPDLLRSLERHGEIQATPQQKRLLCSISAATIDRLLGPDKRDLKPRAHPGHRPATHLQRRIPIRTFADWDDVLPGFLEIDLVLHCGSHAGGEYIHTLTMTDIATGWTICAPFMGRSQRFCVAALEETRRHLPFPLRGIHSDNDSAFINDHFRRYTQQIDIEFTRSRPGKKNDQCRVEQKNADVVRKTVGYARFDTPHQLDTLARLWALLALYQNYFQPSRKLVAKERRGAKVKRTYDAAQTPAQRLLARRDTPAPAKKALRATFRDLNPVKLLRSINALVDELHER